MLQNLNLRTKLNLSFGLIVSIFLFVNIYANLRLSTLQKSNRDLANVHVPAIIAIAEIKILLAEFRASQLDHVISTDALKMELEENQMTISKNNIDKKQHDYKLFLEKINTEKEQKTKKLYEAFENLWEEYLNKYTYFIKLSRNNQNIKAANFLETDAKIVFDNMIEKLDKLLINNKDSFSKLAETENERYNQNVFINLMLLLIPLILTGGIATYLIHIIRKPIQNLEKAANEVATGNLTAKIENIKTNDEIGRLAKAFNKMTAKLETNQNELEIREWFRNGRNELNQIINESIDAQLTMGNFSQEIITFLVSYLEARVGTVYLLSENKTELEYVAGYALDSISQTIKVGQNILGEIAENALSKIKNKKQKVKPTFINQLAPDYLQITSSLGKSAAQNLLVIPFQFEGDLIGLIEIGAWQNTNLASNSDVFARYGIL